MEIQSVANEIPATFIDLSVQDPAPIQFTYTNYKGETEERHVKPLRRALWFGATLYHPALQWFLHGWDLDRNAERDFAVKDIEDWRLA
jgi:predicted DNA-binding transcriptional regulator YafY